jgi:hypothetical protein
MSPEMTLEKILERESGDINTKIALALAKQVDWSLNFTG